MLLTENNGKGKLPPFANLTDNEIQNIQALEKYFGDRFYLIAFKKTS
jgi:hypothetical protein